MLTDNNGNHAQNKTRRRFLPNVQNKSLHSDILNEMVRVKISAAGMRSVESNGGLDAFLLGTHDARLGPDAIKVKRRIQTKQRKDLRRNAA